MTTTLTASNEYAVQDLFPLNEIHVIFGPHRAGKTTLALQMFGDFCAGRNIFGYQSYPLPACFVSCERSATVLHDHMRRVKVDGSLPNLSLVGRLKREEFNLEGAYALVKVKVPDIRVIFFDGFNKLCPGKWYDDKDVSQFLIEANALCHSRQLTIIGTLNSTKAKEGNGYPDPLDRVSGSGSWSSVTDSKIMIERFSLKDVSNAYRTMTFFPSRLPECRRFAGFTQDGLLEMLNDSPQNQTSNLSPLEKFKLSCEDLDCETQISFQAIVEQYDIPERSLYRWLEKQVNTGKMVRVGKGIYRKAHIV